MAQKRLSWINLPFGSAPKTSSDVSSWSKHDVKLFAAVKKGDTDKVKSILKRGTIDPTKIEPNDGISSLHAAAANGKLDILNLFLSSEVNIESPDITGKTALHHAADKGKADVTKRLLRAGANVSAVDHDRLSALHYACSSGMIGCLLELLAMPNSPVNARDKDGKSPLSYAAWKGQASLCKLLLEKGAQINSRDNSGCTPLILAGMNGSAELCSFLLAQGADLTLTDNNGHNALWHCTNSKRGAHLHAARVIQEAMMGNSGRPYGRDAPVRAHSEREVAERTTTTNVHYESTEEEPKENLYEGINEQDPDYSDDDAPSSASTAAATAGPWEEEGAVYGNEARPGHVMRTDTYLMRSDDNQRRSLDEAIYSDINYVEQPTDEYDGLETMGGGGGVGEEGRGQEEIKVSTDDLLEGWRDRLKRFEDESRSDSEADESEVKDPNQLLITFAQETNYLGAEGSASSVAAVPPPLSPADTFFNNLIATIGKRDQPPMVQDSKDLLFPFDLEAPAADKDLGSDGSQSDDELPFDTIYRENMPILTGSSVANDAYQLEQHQQELEHKYHSQLEDMERKMSDVHESNNSLSQQLELSKDQTTQANKDCDSVKQRLEAAIGIKTWLHNELQALYNSIETSEKKLMTQTGRQESHDGKGDDFDMLSDLEGYKQHIDYMLETSNVDGQHDVDIDASAQKTSLKMMEIRLDRLVKENVELRAKIKEEQQRKADGRYDDFEKRMAHEYQKLDEEIEFRDANEMIAYIKDSIAEISRLREQNAAMATRLQSLDDLGIVDQRSLFSELERTQALNKNLMDKIMTLQRSIEEESATLKAESDMVKNYGEVAVQRDIFVKEYDNLKLLLEKKMAESHVSQDEIRQLDEMRNKQKELLLIVARMEETGQQKEIELQLKKEQIADYERQLEDYGLIASERDLLRRDLYALSTMKTELDVNSTELNELRRINLDLSETKKELLETIDRRDAVCDEKERQIVDLNRKLQDFGKLAAEKDSILRSLSSDVDEHPMVLVSTSAESYSAPSEELTESWSGQEFGQIKLKVEKLKEDLENKHEELQRSVERNNELQELILVYKTAEDDNRDRIEELSQKLREFELLLDIKKEEHKTEIRIAEAEHIKAWEMLSHENKVLKHDLEEAREKARSVEKLKTDIHLYDDTLRQKKEEVEQLGEKITALQREALKRSAIDDDNDRIRDEHRMMAREIFELKLALESSKDREISAVKTVKSDLLMAPLLPTTDAIEEIRKLTAENARLQERVADLEKAFLKRISTNSRLEREDRHDELDISNVDGRKHQFQIMDDKDLEKSWKDLEDLSPTGPINAASPGYDTVNLEKSGLKSHVNAPVETWNGVLAENRTLKVEAVNARKKMEAELIDAELRNVALKENNRDLQQEVRNLRKTIDELMRHTPLAFDAWPLKEGSYSESNTMAIRTAEDTLEKWKEVERLDKENSELRKEIGDRRNHDRVNEYQSPVDETQIRKISELMLANSNLIAANNILQFEVKELKTTVEHYMSERTEENSDHSDSEESDVDKPFKSKAVEISHQRRENLYNEKEVENYGKLAVERDILLNEVSALKKLMINQGEAEQCHRNMENNNWYQSNVKEHTSTEVNEAMSNYGKLATEKDILENEVHRLKQILDNLTSSHPVKNTRKEKSDDDSDNEQRRIDDYGKIVVERDIFANEVKNLKKLLEEMRASNKTVTQINHDSVQSKHRNEDSDDSDDDEHKRVSDIGKIAVERDVLFAENIALKKLLDELKSAESQVKHTASSVSKSEKSDDDTDNEQRRTADYGRLAAERDILVNEVKNLKKLLEESKASDKTVIQIHQDLVQTKQRNDDSDDSDDDERKRSSDIGKIAVDRDVLIAENKALKTLLDELQSAERPVKHTPSSVSKSEKSDDDSDNEQRRIDDYGKIVVERDILANEVKNLKKLLEEMRASDKTVIQIHQDLVQTKRRNEDSHDSDSDERKRSSDIGKIAVERDVLFAENKALKKLLDELQSAERPVKHTTTSVSKAEKSDDDSDNEQRRIDDYGKIVVERDILANEVKNLKKLLEEIRASDKTVIQIHQDLVQTKQRNEDSDDSDDDVRKRSSDIGKIAVDRDVLIAENKALKKLLEELQSAERPVKHTQASVSKAENSDDDSDNEQRRIDDYGKIVVERDILANEVKNLKKLLEEIRVSDKTVIQIHQDLVQTKQRNEDSDDSDDDVRKRSSDIGKIAVDRDVLIAENKVLKKLLEELQSAERPVKHTTTSVSKAEKSDDDSDNEQRRIDDYGKLAVERDILVNEVKNLKKLLEESKAPDKTVIQIHQDLVQTKQRNDDSDDSDDDVRKRSSDIGKIAVDRDVLIAKNKALKKLLDELQSVERPVKHTPSSVSKAEKSDDDSDNEQRRNDDYGRLAVERDILANEVKNLKKLLEESKASDKTVIQIHQDLVQTKQGNEDSDDSDDDERKRSSDIGKIAVDRDVLIAENKVLKKLLEELQSVERPVKHTPSSVIKAENSDDDSDNEQRRIDDYGRLAVERDILLNEVKNLKKLLEESKASDKTVIQIHQDLVQTKQRNEDSDDSDDDEQKRSNDIGKIAVDRDVLFAENKALKKLLDELKSAERPVKHTQASVSKAEKSDDDSDNEQRRIDDYGKIVVERDILANEVKNLKKLLEEMRASDKTVIQIHQDLVQTKQRNEDSDDSDDDVRKRSSDIGKIAVDRDALFAENKALKKLLDELQSAERPVKHTQASISKAEKSDDDSDNEQRRIDDYGKIVVERDILANEVKNLKKLLEEMRASDKTVIQIHHDLVQTKRRNEDSHDSDSDERKRSSDIGKIAVERDVLFAENKALMKLLDELQSAERPVKHTTTSVSKAEKSDDDSDNEQRRIDDYGKIVVERDILDSDDSDDDVRKRSSDIGKIAVDRDVLIAENKALKKLLDELQSVERPVKHTPSSVSKAEKSDDDSDNEQRRNDDYGRLAVERDILVNEVKNLKKLLEESKASDKTVIQIHQDLVQTKQGNEDSDDSDDDERKRSSDIGKIAVDRDVLIAENKVLKKLLEELQSVERPVKHTPSSVIKAENSDDDSDNEQRRIDDYGRLAVERDILVNEVKNLKKLLEESKASDKTVIQIHHDLVQTKQRNEDSDDSDDDERKRSSDIGKIAVERDVLFAENKALMKLLDELQSAERPVKHTQASVSKAEKSDDDSDNEQRRIDDYGKIVVERDILANEVKNLKKLLEEMRASDKTVIQIHQDLVQTKQRNEDSDDSDDDVRKRSSDIGKIAVDRDVLFAENKALKKLLDELQSAERPVKHTKASVSKAEKSDDDSDNEQRRIDDYGKIVVERDILANEVKNLKKLLEEMRASDKTVIQIHHDLVQTKQRNEDSDDSDDDERKRSSDIGKIAVERDVLFAENKALMKLLDELQSAERPVKHTQASVSKAEKSDDDSDNEQRRIDDYGKIVVERDILANEVKNLKKVLEEMRASDKTVIQIHQDLVQTKQRNEDSDDSDDDVRKRSSDIGKIAVDRDVLIAENKALKKLLDELQSVERPVKHTPSSVSKAEKSDDDSDNEQRRNDDYGRLAVERDILANEVKNLKKLLEESKASDKTVIQIHQDLVQTKQGNEDSDDSDDDERKRSSDIGKIAVDRDVLIAENKALKKLLEELQSVERPVKHTPSSVSKSEKSDDDSDNEQRRIDDYGRLAVERDILVNEVKNLKKLFEESKASDKTVIQIHQDLVQTKQRNEDSDDSDDDVRKRSSDIGKIAVDRDVLFAENKALKKLLDELKSAERPVKHTQASVSKAEKSDDDSDNEQRRIDDYGRLAVERDILVNEVKNLKKLLEESNASDKTVIQIHQDLVQTKQRNEDSDDSDDDERKRSSDIGKIAVERDVLFAENKALKKLLDELQSAERPVKHTQASVSKAEKSDDDSDNEQRRIDDYGKIVVERDILANEVKNLKKLLEEMRASDKTVIQIHQDLVQTKQRNEDSDDSDDDVRKRSSDIGKIAVDRDVLIAENKALKKLLDELQSAERPVKHTPSSVSKAEKSDDDSDNEQRRVDDYGKIVVERDIFANEVKNLKKLLEEMRASDKTVIQIHQDLVQTKKRNEDSEDSDDDERKRSSDIGKIAVERDVLFAENIALKKLLDELQSAERPVKHTPSSVSKAENSDDDSDNEQRRIDDYGRLAVERDILVNEVKNLKKLLEEMRASDKTVIQIHQDLVQTKQRNEDSHDSDDDVRKRSSDIGKIAVERDVLFAENIALKKLLDELQSAERPVRHTPSSVSKAENSDDDSDNEQRRNDDFGKIVVERDILANEVKNLKKLLEEMRASDKTVTQIHHDLVRTKQRNEDSGDSDSDERKRSSDIGKIAVERDVLFAENIALKKLLDELQSAERPVKHTQSSVGKVEKSDDDSDNEQRLTDDYGRLAVERDVLADENRALKNLLDEMQPFSKPSDGRLFMTGSVEVDEDLNDGVNLGHSVKNVLQGTSSYGVSVKQNQDNDHLTKNRELEELKKRLESFDKVTTERDNLKMELASLKLGLDGSFMQPFQDTAIKSKRRSVPNLGSAPLSEISLEPADPRRRVLELEEANHRLERSVSEIKEIAEKQSSIIQKKEKLIRSFNDKEKTMSDMEKQLNELKDFNLKLSQRVTEQEEIAEKQSEIIKKKEKRISEINIFPHEYEKLSVEKDALCKEVKHLKLLLENQKGFNPEIGHSELHLGKAASTNESSLDMKYVVENDIKALTAELEKVKRNKEELLTEVSNLEETLQDQDRTIMKLQEKEKEFEAIVNNLKRDLDVARDQLRTEYRSSDLVNIGRRDENILRCQRDQITGSPLSSDDEESQAALNALRRKIEEKEKMIQRMDSADEEKQFLEEEVEELREKLKRQDSTMDNIGIPESAENDDLEDEIKTLRHDLSGREREIERLRTVGEDEHRELKNQIERLKQEVNARPSHLTTEYEASLLTRISDLEEKKNKLQNELSQNLEERDNEIREIRKAEVEERRELQNQIEHLRQQVNEHPSHLTADHEAGLLTAIADLKEQNKKLQSELRQNLEERDHEIEIIRIAEVEERRKLQNQIESLKKDVNEHQSNLTADHEADLLTTIADLEQQKKKLQSMIHEKEAQSQQEIKELVAENDEYMNRLTKVKKEAQKQYAELVEDNEGLLENNGLLQKQCAELADEQEELLERDRLLQIEVKKLKEELQAAENKWFQDKAKLNDDNKILSEQLELGVGRPMTDARPPENIPDLRDIVEMQEQTLAKYEKKLKEQTKQIEDFEKLSVENDALRRELNILRGFAGESKNRKDYTLVEIHQQSSTASDDQEVSSLKFNAEHLTKQNKELRKKIEELELSIMEEKEKSDRKLLELKWSLTKSEDEMNHRERENKELREKIEGFERTISKKSSAVDDSRGFGDVQESQKENNGRLESEILELRLESTRSEELRSQRHLPSDERHTQLETLVQQLESDNAKLKLKVSQLEAELKLLDGKTETKENNSASQLQQNQEQQKLRSSKAPEYDISYVRQLEGDMELLREVNRALSKDIADIQYRLAEKLVLMRSDGIADGDSDRDYLHKKMKDFTQQSLRYLAEIQDLEDKNRRERQETKRLRQENDELRDEVDTLQEIYHLHYTSPKDLVNRMRLENNKLQQFIKILEQRLFKKVSSVPGSETEIDVKSISVESFGLLARPSEDLASEEGSSFSSSQRLLFAGTLDECHQEIQRLRQINKDLERKYKEIVSTYRSHLLASIQGRLDPEVKEALIRILQMKPVEYDAR